MKILVIDDEQDICEILKFNLEIEGYEVETANSAEEALSRMDNGRWKMEDTVDGEGTSYFLPDLILLDVMMGEMSGFQMARKLKDNPETANIPIIFTTALDDEDNTVKGLNIGADDYIAKPLSMKEVKARVKAVLRRTTTSNPSPMKVENISNGYEESPHTAPSQQRESCDDAMIVYADLVINDINKTVTVKGEDVSLTKIEFELLKLLVQKAGKVFSREELLKRCWPSDTYVLDRTVDVNITRLRKKIGVYGKQIRTRFGYGYTFEK